MEVTTELFPDGTGEDFKVLSLSARATFARNLTDRLKVGESLNYISDKIAETQMQTISYDIGSNFQTGIYNTVLGMSITNFGPKMSIHGSDLLVIADVSNIEVNNPNIFELRSALIPKKSDIFASC